MKNGKKRLQKITTLNEFEKTYFPQAYKKKRQKEQVEPRKMGISMARKSLQKIMCHT